MHYGLHTAVLHGHKNIIGWLFLQAVQLPHFRSVRSKNDKLVLVSFCRKMFPCHLQDNKILKLEHLRFHATISVSQLLISPLLYVAMKQHS